MNRVVPSIWVLLLLFSSGPESAAESNPSSQAPGRGSLLFTAAGDGGYAFDTGVLRGRLRAGGKSLGLTLVTHIPSGTRLDRSNGLLSHYRVFTKGVRYGGGAWDWPSEAELSSGGSVEVRWPSTEQRPFQMRAVYRWRTPEILDLETVVKADKDLAGFESFLANYLSESFTNAAVFGSPSAETENQPGFIRLRAAAGAWQMFPREDSVLPVIHDGRWRLEPNPVNWTIRPHFGRPLAFRRDPASGLTAILMSPASDCFAVAAPEETEGHYSLYFSLFGRDLKAGQVAVARTRLVIRATAADKVPKLYQEYTE
jgi:hypothetical protein